MSLRGVAAAVVTAVLLARGSLAQETPPTLAQLVAELGNDDPHVRLRAVQTLKIEADPEAAIPLTRSLADTDDDVQLQAIGAELNIFLAERVVPRKRVALVVEVRNDLSAVGTFNRGANALDPRPVPTEVLTALRGAVQDENPRVSVEALYALGALSENAYGPARAALLSAAAAELAPLVGVPHAEVRAAAVRVIQRMYSWRMGDPAVDERIGDAAVTALNDREYGIRLAAMDTLGGLRYDRGVQALTDQYQHFERGPVAVSALTALARIAHPSSLPIFVAALEGRDVSLRTAAIEGLARSGASDQLDRIHDLLAKERNEDARLAGHFADVLMGNGALDDLVGALARERSRPRALRYLIDIGPGRAHLFVPHVQDPQPTLRVDLLEVLGLSGDPAALTSVERMQQDSDPGVARAARRAMLRLQGGSAAVP